MTATGTLVGAWSRNDCFVADLSIHSNCRNSPITIIITPNYLEREQKFKIRLTENEWEMEIQINETIFRMCLV